MPDSRVQEFTNAKLIYQDYGYSLIELNSDQIHLHTDLGPVSYTHLDVYKRQVLCRLQQGSWGIE